MPNLKKNCLEVNRDVEKQFYRICKDLEIHGEALVENTNREEWKKTKHIFGHRAKPLIEENLLEPMWKTDYPNNGHRLIRVKKNVKVEEIRGKKFSWFRLKKII